MGSLLRTGGPWNFLKVVFEVLARIGSYLYRNGDVIGKLQKPYCIAVRDRRHYFRKFGGFALSVESFEWLLNEGFTYLQIRYKPENRLFIYRIADFSSGYKIDYPPHGEQYVLPISKVENRIKNI